MQNIKTKNIKKHRKKAKKVIIFSLLGILLFAVTFTSVYAYMILHKIPTDKTFNESNVSSNVSDDILDDLTRQGKDIKDFTNIALFSLDKLAADDAGHSDSIIILTIDKAHKKLKLSSVMRDSYVSIDGFGKDKITHAYAYGGPELAVKTLNQNFNLNIKDYVSVDFLGMAKIVDILGGVDIEIKPAQILPPEIMGMNYHILEMCNAANIKYTPVEKPGLQKLNGIQAVAYARDRHSTANGDFDRTEKQRELLTKIANKLKATDIVKFQKLIDSISPYVATSLEDGDILSLGTFLISSGFKNIEQQRFPLDNYYKDEYIDGVYYLTFNEKATADQITKYIFQDVKPK